VAAHAKQTNRSKRVDSVRASRDGHQFHEAWVARRALGLLLPRFYLYGIAVEGLSEEDEEGAPAAAVEIADATFYYGNGTSFESSARIEVAQFKYSISKAGTPLRIADLRKTFIKFVATEKELLSTHGAEAVARTVTYSINSNRPFASEMLEAFRSAATGQPAVSAAADAQLSQLRSAVKQSDDRLRRFAARVLLVGRMDSLEAVERGNARTVADWSASNDALARARIGELRDMVRKKAGSHGQRDKLVTRVDVLSALGHVRFGRDVAPLEAWITDPHVELHIDDNDPSGVPEALQRPRPATRIIRTFRLRPEKPWTDSWIAPGKRVAFRSRAWGRKTWRGDRDDTDSGVALFATRPFVTDFLAATDRDLLVLIKLEHYRESERYNPVDDEPSDRFTHAYSLLLVDRHLRVRPLGPASDDVVTVASLDKYSIHDFQKRFAALRRR
jgi:hypothetical protein